MSMEADEDLSLEEALGAALDAGKPQQAEQQEPVEGEQETPAEAEERAKYVREGRRFVKEAGEPAKDGKEQVAAPAKPAWKPTWYKDEYGPWEQISEPLRNALRDQERNAAQAIEKHSTAAKSWEPVQKLLEPHQAQLAASGTSPQQYVTNLVNADKYLRQSPVEAMDWLCQQYLQCDLRGLVQWMDEQGHQGVKVDPVQQELNALKQQVQQLSQLPQTQAREAAARQIADWAKDKPDFPAVRERMSALAKGNPEASLDELYEEARWADPSIRDRILQEREDKRIKELQGKRAAGAQSPRGGQPNGAQRNQRPTMSLEDEIAMHLDGGV